MGVGTLELVKIFRPFFFLQIPRIESWLSQQASKGLRVVSYKRGTFTFAKCKEKERVYYVYNSPLTDKNDPFLKQFFMLKGLYGKRKSEINKTLSPIIEIDLQKIDKDYKFFALARNRYYQKHHTKMLLAKTVFFLAFSVCSFWERALLWFALASLIAMLYSAMSIAVLKKQRKSISSHSPNSANGE